MTAMDFSELVEIRDTGVMVTRLGLGLGPLGNLFAPVSQGEAIAVIRRALALGIRYFDVAPIYGFGLAEQRLGRALQASGAESVVVSTKVGRLLRADAPPDPDLFFEGEPFFKDTPPVNPVWDLTYDGALASLTESLERLSLDKVDIVFIHEPPENLFETALSGAYRALAELRRAGAVRAIGLGWDRPDLMAAFIRRTDLDCVLLANRYTLLDRTAAADLLPLCAARGITVIAGGVFNSGVLADPRPGATFDYVPAPVDVIENARRLAAICERAGLPLAAAALQFPFRHRSVCTVLMGVRSRAEIEEDAALFEHPIPEAVWGELEGAGHLTMLQG